MKRALAVVVVVAWLAFALVLRDHVAPHLGHIGGHHSDEAIAQLMANARGFAPFDLYFWGQERTGAWPWLTARGLGGLFGFGWTCDGLHWLVILFLFSAAWSLRRMAGRWGAPLAMALLVALLYDRRGDGWNVAAARTAELASRPWRPTILTIESPYGWMLGALLWGWFSLRRAVEALEAGAFRKAWAWGAFAAFWSCLATWSSPQAFAFIGLLGAFEVVLAGLRDRALVLRRSAIVAVCLVVPLAFRAILNRWFESDAAQRSLGYERLEPHLDWGHLRENFAWSFDSLSAFKAWIMFPIALVLAVVIAVRLLRQGRGSVEYGLVVAALALPVLAAVSALSVTVTDFGRIHWYPARYHAPTDFFSIIGACAGLLALLPARLRDREHAPAVAALGLAAYGLLVIPANPTSSRVPTLQRVCADLAATLPGGVLLGSYWGTYAFVDGSLEKPLTPVVIEADFNRTTWTIDQLHASNEVIVSHWKNGRAGSATDPAPFLWEHNTLLQFSRALPIEGGNAFSIYRNRSQVTQPVRALASGQVIEAPCLRVGCLPLPPVMKAEQALQLEFPAQAQGDVVLFFGSLNERPKPLPAFAITPVTSEPGAPVEVTQTVREMILVLHFKGAPVSGFHLSYAADSMDPAPPLRAALMVRPDV